MGDCHAGALEKQESWEGCRQGGLPAGGDLVGPTLEADFRGQSSHRGLSGCTLPTSFYWEGNESQGGPAGAAHVTPGVRWSPTDASVPHGLSCPLEKAATLQNPSPLTQSLEPAELAPGWGPGGRAPPPRTLSASRTRRARKPGAGTSPDRCHPPCFPAHAPGPALPSHLPTSPRGLSLAGGRRGNRGLDPSAVGSLGSHKGDKWPREGSAGVSADSGHSRPENAA